MVLEEDASELGDLIGTKGTLDPIEQAERHLLLEKIEAMLLAKLTPRVARILRLRYGGPRTTHRHYHAWHKLDATSPFWFGGSGTVG